MTFEKRVRPPTVPPIVRSHDITILARTTPDEAQAVIVDGDAVELKALSAAELGSLVTRLLERVRESQRATFTIILDHKGPGSGGRIVIQPPIIPTPPKGDEERVVSSVQRITEIGHAALSTPLLGTHQRVP